MPTWFTKYKVGSRFLSLVLAHGAAVRLARRDRKSPVFDPTGLSEDDIMLMEMNGDIIPDPENEGKYITNPEKSTAFPGPMKGRAKRLSKSSPNRSTRKGRTIMASAG